MNRAVSESEVMDSRARDVLADMIESKGYALYAFHPDSTIDDSRVRYNHTVMLHNGQHYTFLPRAENPASPAEVRQKIEECAGRFGSMHPVVRTKEHEIILRGMTLEDRTVRFYTTNGDKRMDILEAMGLVLEIGKPGPYEHLGVAPEPAP